MEQDRPRTRNTPDTGARETAPGESVGPARPIDPAARPASRPDEARPADATQAPTDVQPAVQPPPERQRPPAPKPPARTARRPRQRAGSAVDRVRRASFPVVMRGYDRSAVDAYVADVAQLVAELEATQLPESVVERALDQVGDQTSAILKHAHEASEEITARSRAQAEEHLARAEREAGAMRREAEERAQRVEEDTREVWEERRRLIEDIRHLADDVLGLADDALERLPAPGAEADTDTDEAEGLVEEGQPSTVEVPAELEDDDDEPPRTGAGAG